MLPAQMLGGPRVLARLKEAPEYLRADVSVYFWVLPFTPEASASLQVEIRHDQRSSFHRWRRWGIST